ncbi:MAG: lycopene cyclase family protein [Saprospiraceae bacterium]
MSSTIYDYAIIGAGGAGLHLVLAMIEDNWFVDKKILILDKADKKTNDKTWSFWEKGSGKWDAILEKSWKKGKFNTSKKSIDLDLAPYLYKTLPSINFYKLAKQKIAAANNITWIQDEINTVSNLEKQIKITGKQGNYTALQVFDSRIDKGFLAAKDRHFTLQQHFKGWEIETEKPVFDTTTFVMMDYQIKWQDSASFTYVLPFSPTKAMVEFTLFTSDLIEYDAYDILLKKYIQDILKIDQYHITKVEYGIIPMSDYPFQKANQKGVMKIGTAGAHVKPSSGYAFKNMEKVAQKIILNLKNNRSPAHNILSKKFYFYDSLYLDVLVNHNELGESIYTDMFDKNSIQQIFKFLDEETSLWEDFKIILSFKFSPFLKALWYYLTGMRIK